MKKTFSLKRQLRWTVVISYCFILALLAAFDYFALFSAYEQTDRAYSQCLDQFAQTVQQAVDSMMITFDELAINNDDFSELSRIGLINDGGALSGKQQLRVQEIVYSQAQWMNSQVYNQTGVEGFCLSYENGRARRYVFDPNADDKEKERLLQWHMLTTRESTDSSQWSVMASNTEVYYVRYYKKQMAALSGFINLNQIPFRFEEKIGSEPILLWSAQGKFLGDADLARSIGLTEESDTRNLGGYMVYKSTVGTTPLTVFMLTQWNLVSKLDFFRMALLVFTALSIVAAAMLYRFLAKRTIEPLECLMETMNDVRQDSMSMPPEVEYYVSEFTQIDQAFRVMLGEIQQLKISAYEEKLNSQRVQMQYLQLQLRPHFFLNCLKTLNAMAGNGKAEDMQELIYHTSAYLRFLLECEDALIPLSREMAYVEHYQALQNAMTSGKIHIEAEFDKGLEDFPVPPLTVQTFVENSCKYALRKERQHVLRLKIKGTRLLSEGRAYLDIRISDDGIGYPQEVLTILNRREAKAEEHVGIGIINLKRRCNLLYGDGYEYFFENDDGAVSEIILPYMEGSCKF